MNFGLPEEIEEMRAAFVKATTPEEQKAIAVDIQAHVMDNVNYIMMGEYLIPQARRTTIQNMIPSPVPVFWNMEKTAE